jgi:hypothetical protein
MNDPLGQANPLPGSVRAMGRLEPLLLTRLANAWFMKDQPVPSVMKTGEHVGFISNQLLPGFRVALLSFGMG